MVLKFNGSQNDVEEEWAYRWVEWVREAKTLSGEEFVHEHVSQASSAGE